MCGLFANVYKKNEQKSLSAIGILGSPRQGSNCDLILDSFLSGLESGQIRCEKIILNDLKYCPCQACPEISSDGHCQIDDDFQIIYEKIMRADIIVLASPLYFGGVTAQVKAMIDRFQCHWQANRGSQKKDQTLEKKGVFICVAAVNNPGACAPAISVVKNFFATIGARYEKEFICTGLEARAEIADSPDKLEKARALGQSLAA